MHVHAYNASLCKDLIFQSPTGMQISDEQLQTLYGRKSFSRTCCGVCFCVCQRENVCVRYYFLKDSHSQTLDMCRKIWLITFNLIYSHFLSCSPLSLHLSLPPSFTYNTTSCSFSSQCLKHNASWQKFKSLGRN